MRDSFVFYRSFAESVKNLPPEEYKKVMQSILDYALDGKEPEQSGIEYTVFCLVKPQIDANNKRYENGRKGGRPQEQNQSYTMYTGFLILRRFSCSRMAAITFASFFLFICAPLYGFVRQADV